ncbi:MFS transporter [Gammaproteobacteria bacterium]|nr:MFS transporter [Gammaproteobacteria bacterium]
MKLPKNFFNLVRVILGISLAGVVAGINLPLSTLTLKSWGITSSVIGMAASMMGLSAAVATPFLPRMVKRFGQIPVLRISLVVLPLAILALPLYQNLYAWFILRFIIGLAATNIWVLSEIWINSFAEDKNRGRIIAIYTSLLSLGFILGVLIMSFTSVETFGGFYISAALAIVVSVPLWSMKDIGDFETPKNVSFFKFLSSSPILMGSSWMMGFLYAASAGLLPIFALPYLNEDYSAASRTVAWLATGELMLPLLIGWLADKYDKRNLMILLTFIAILVLFLIPVFFHLPLVRILLLFLLGGVTMGFYVLGLTMLGEQFKGQILVSANASFIFFLSIGEIIGPPVIGQAMDLFGNAAFGWAMGVISLLFLSVFYFTRALIIRK